MKVYIKLDKPIINSKWLALHVVINSSINNLGIIINTKGKRLVVIENKV